MSLINRPHDKFFKETMSDAETARDFLMHYLPEGLVRLIDLDHLSLQKDSFIEKELQETFSDLLYKTSLAGQDTYLYFLFEHKSYLSTTTALQLLKYMVSIWAQKANKEKAFTLPVIIPLVIYHGEDRWTASRSLSGLMELDTLPASITQYIPDFEFTISQEGSDTLMTIAETLINEGMEKGMKKGFLNARSETTINLLSKKFGVLPNEMKNTIQHADAETLNRILDHIFDLTSLEDVNRYLTE